MIDEKLFKLKTFFMAGIAAGLLFLGACERNPVDRLTNPLDDGSVPGSSGIFVIYDDELKTGGGVAFIPGGENQSIDFLDRDAPLNGKKALRYSWNGGDVTNSTTTQHLFAGFMLMTIEDVNQLDASTGKDLTSAGYTKLTFWARGGLDSNTTLRVEGPDDGTGGITPQRLDITDLSASWQQYSISVPSSDFANVKIYFIATLQYSQPPRTTIQGEGGTVYFDDIQYSR